MEHAFIEQQLSDGVLSIFQRPDAGLKVVISTGETVLSQAVTSPVVAIDSSQIILAVRWGAGQINCVWADSTVVFSTDPSLPASTRHEIRTATSTLVGAAKPEDYTEPSQRAQRLRAHKLANWERDPKRIPGGADYAFTSLRGEIDQITDLVDLARSGKLHHAPGAMARARLMLIGKPMGLLQVCAAYLDAPLPMFTTATKFTLPDHLPPESAVAMTGSGRQIGPYINPVDLDVWLDLPAMICKQRKYPAREVIREIGNTVASHRDLDIQPSVDLLMSLRTTFTIPIDQLQQVCLVTSEIVLILAQRLAAARG